MRALLVLTLSCVVAVLASGCSSSSLSAKSQWHRWSQRYGGVVDREVAAAEGARATDALASLAPACECWNVSIRILDHEAVGAFAFRDGSLFVTRGLLSVMDDEELAAAVAHELGHLALEGDEDSEQQADQWGTALLARVGLPSTAMLRMLRKLQAHTDPDFYRIGARIRVIEDGKPLGI